MKKLFAVLFVLSSIYAFHISGCGDDPTAPEPPTRLVILYYPEWEMVIPDTNVLFRWGTTTSIADSFKLEITQDSNFQTGITRFGLTEQQRLYNPLPNGDTNYFYWRVTGFWRTENDSDQSIIQKFKQRN